MAVAPSVLLMNGSIGVSMSSAPEALRASLVDTLRARGFAPSDLPPFEVLPLWETTNYAPEGMSLAAILPRASHRYGLYGLSPEVSLENFSNPPRIAASDPLVWEWLRAYVPHTLSEGYTRVAEPAAALAAHVWDGWIGPVCDEAQNGLTGQRLSQLPAAAFTPAPCLGIFGIFCKKRWADLPAFKVCAHGPTEAAWTCESGFFKWAKATGVEYPLFALATPTGDGMSVTAGWVCDGQVARAHAEALVSDPALLLRQIAQRLTPFPSTN